ncbi:insulinase family protein [bacterium]|nr:insulinase family protein [candidate division CSSED10-310 bacterium]
MIRATMRYLPAVCIAGFMMACIPVKMNQPPVGIDKRDSATLSLKEYLERADWDQKAVIPFPVPEQFTLENGLKVFVVERRDIPMVYARAQIRGGSIYDPPGKSGLAYLTGWVLTEGTESYPDEAIDAVMDRHGAFVTSVAYNESCIATLNCLSRDVRELFPCFAEILSRADFEDSNLEEGRNYIIGDLMQSSDDPGDLCYRRFRRDVFGDHPYAKPHKGTIEDLKTITRGQVLEFYRKFYRPDRAVLVVIGDISKDQVETLCRDYLSGWERSSEPLPPIPPPRPVSGTQIHIIDKDTVQAQVVMGHIGIDRVNPDRFKIETLNRILGGGGLFTRLSTEVRVKRGLTYGVYSFFARREFTGEFAVGTFTKVDTLGETVRVILDELRKIREEPVLDGELQDAKQGLIGSHPLEFEQYEDIAGTLVHMNFYGLPLDDVTLYPRYIRSVTREDILKTAQRYIHPDDLVITIVGPADRIVPQIESLGPVRIVPEF